MAMLDDIKILCNSNDTNTLNLLIEQCKTIAADYCNRDYTTALDEIVKVMVCERFNKLSADGISSRSYSSISESYTEDFSPMIYSALKKHRKLKKVSSNV